MTVTSGLARLWYPQDTLLDVDKLIRGEGTVRPWLPYKANFMRFYGNNKTNITPKNKAHGRRNITKIGLLCAVDRGCGLALANFGRGCYGNCYNCENMARYHIMCWIPVPQIFNERLLRKDLLRFTDERKHGYEFVRTGDNGEPSYAWNNTVLLGELSIQYDLPLLVVTKTPVRADDYTLERLANADTVIHGSVSALDPLGLRNNVLDLLDRYTEIGGRAVRRVVTAPFKGHLEEYWEIQNALMYEGLSMQQPLRVTGSNPFLHLFDMDAFGPTFNHTTGKPTNRWRSAGDVCYGSRGCYAPSCYECHNHCMTKPYVWRSAQ